MAKKQTPKADAIPSISVLERRLQNPFGEGSPPIPMKQKGWTLHVVNAALRPGRYHDVTRNKGWVPVAPEDIDGDPENFGFDVRDGRIVRGERGQEVLVKMPTKDYERIQMAKAEWNQRRLDPRAVKQAAVDRTAKEYGDEAASHIDSMTLKTSRAPVPLEEHGEEA